MDYFGDERVVGFHFLFRAMPWPHLEVFDELSNNHLSIFSAVICLSCPMVVNSAHTIGSWSLRTEQRRRAF